MPENTEETFEFTLNGGTKWEEKSTVVVRHDGQDYDPAFQGYRPRYSYTITTSKWSYDDNDIHGAVNEVCNLVAASQSLFAFLYSCQEGMPHKEGQLVSNENVDLFPSHVREWAYMHNDEISMANLTLEARGLANN